MNNNASGGEGDWHTQLQDLIESYDWVGAISRIYTNPEEVAVRGPQDRTALHIACEHDAPAVVVQALIAVYPEATSMVGTSDMNPLHITCSSSQALLEVVQVLLEGGSAVDSSMQDVDGDTPLHAACRCGAPLGVLELLLRWNSSVVHLRDYEGLTPLLRLWVRYYVILGIEVIEAVSTPEQINGDLSEAWSKTKLLLKTAYHGLVDIPPTITFRPVHAAAAVDCPRAVLRTAILLYPEQLELKDEQGNTPLLIAIAAPIYKVHDLSEDGYDMNRMYGFPDEDPPEQDSDNANNTDDPLQQQLQIQQQQESANEINCPSVIEVILETNSNPAKIPNNAGRLPLCQAIAKRKTWKNGLKSILDAYPDALSLKDDITKLFPFMLASAFDHNNPSSIICFDTIYRLLKANPELVRGGIIDRQEKPTRNQSITNKITHLSMVENRAKKKNAKEKKKEK